MSLLIRRINVLKTIISDNRPDLDLDDFLLLEEENKPKKKHKKKKKDNYKKKNKKKKSKKYKFEKHKRQGFFSKISDSVNVDVKSKVKVNITDETIGNILDTGLNIVRCIVTKGKN